MWAAKFSRRCGSREFGWVALSAANTQEHEESTVSRIGRKPIEIPKGVEVKVNGQSVSVKGAKGTLVRTIHPDVKVSVEGAAVKCVSAGVTQQQKALWGLSRMLIDNMVVGVSQGYTKNLEIVGVGYKAELKGKDLTVTVGHSHPVVVKAEKNVELATDGPTKIIVRGPDKEAVGRVAAGLRDIRPPEPYKGKGIRFSGEHIVKKAGKTAGK
jgi:large subunit ribosomal protein L6